MEKRVFFWHKLHSLTGIIPVGYYLVQHLTLNSFSLAGPSYFDGVISFFDSMPKFFLYALEIFGIWLPLLFHAVYGVFIVSGSIPNITSKALRYRESWMYTFQRITGFWTSVHRFYYAWLEPSCNKHQQLKMANFWWLEVSACDLCSVRRLSSWRRHVA